MSHPVSLSPASASDFDIDVSSIDRRLDKLRAEVLPQYPLIMRVRDCANFHLTPEQRYSWTAGTPFSPDEAELQYSTFIARNSKDSLLITVPAAVLKKERPSVPKAFEGSPLKKITFEAYRSRNSPAGATAMATQKSDPSHENTNGPVTQRTGEKRALDGLPSTQSSTADMPAPPPAKKARTSPDPPQLLPVKDAPSKEAAVTSQEFERAKSSKKRELPAEGRREPSPKRAKTAGPVDGPVNASKAERPLSHTITPPDSNVTRKPAGTELSAAASKPASAERNASSAGPKADPPRSPSPPKKLSEILRGLPRAVSPTLPSKLEAKIKALQQTPDSPKGSAQPKDKAVTHVPETKAPSPVVSTSSQRTSSQAGKSTVARKAPETEAAAAAPSSGKDVPVRGAATAPGKPLAGAVSSPKPKQTAAKTIANPSKPPSSFFEHLKGVAKTKPPPAAAAATPKKNDVASVKPARPIVKLKYGVDNQAKMLRILNRPPDGVASQGSRGKAEKKGEGRASSASREAAKKDIKKQVAADTPGLAVKKTHAENKDGATNAAKKPISARATGEKAEKPAAGNKGAHGADTLDEWRSEHAKYTDLGRKLKHRAEDLLRVAGDGADEKDLSRGAMLGLVSVCCYIIAFQAEDQTRRLLNQRRDGSNWRSIVPFWEYVKARSRAFPFLYGLCLQLGAVCHEQIRPMELDAARQAAATARGLWVDGTAALSVSDLIEAFPATWARRARQPLAKNKEPLLPEKYRRGQAGAGTHSTAAVGGATTNTTSTASTSTNTTAAAAPPTDGGFYLPLTNISMPLEAVRMTTSICAEWAKQRGIKWEDPLGV